MSVSTYRSVYFRPDKMPNTSPHKRYIIWREDQQYDTLFFYNDLNKKSMLSTYYMSEEYTISECQFRNDKINEILDVVC